MSNNKKPSKLLQLLNRKHQLERKLDENEIRQEEIKKELKRQKK